MSFRHLFEHLDGKTKGPKTFSGPIDRLLPGFEKLPVVTFEKIACIAPDVSGVDLSRDQKSLFNQLFVNKISLAGIQNIFHMPDGYLFLTEFFV